MREVCGYKSLDGAFHDTKKKCEQADLDFKIRGVANKLDYFYNDLDMYIFREESSDFKLQQAWRYEEKRLMEIIAQKILQHSDSFIEVISRKKELEKELEQLQKQRNSWWLKTKWW